MTNNLRQAQRDMKALAKQVRGVRYTEALLFTYLMTGMITFSTGLNTNPNMLYERVNKEIEKNKGSSFTLYPLIKYKEALLWVLEDKKEGGNYGH